MIFGDPKEFAIEAYHEPSGPQWVGCGRICIYVGGNTIGDIRDNHCSLFHVTDRFRYLARSVGGLWNDSFSGLSDADIFGLIDDDLYTVESDNGLPIFSDFDFLTNSGEMFDGTKTFIYTTPDSYVHVLCRYRDHSFSSGRCSVKYFCAIADAYVGWFDEQLRTVGPPYFPINPFDLNEHVPKNV